MTMPPTQVPGLYAHPRPCQAASPNLGETAVASRPESCCLPRPPGSPATRPVRPHSLPNGVLNVAGRLGPAVFDGGLECGVVEFVLVGVFLGEVGDRLVEFVRAAEVGGQGDAVAGAGVGPGEGPPAHLGVDRHARGDHLLDRRGELPVFQLADVVVVVNPVGAYHVGPAEEDVAFGLHQVLPGDHALAVAGVVAAPAVGGQGRGDG